MRAAAAATPTPPPPPTPTPPTLLVVVATVLALLRHPMPCDGRPTFLIPDEQDGSGPLDGQDFLSFFLDSAGLHESDTTLYPTERYTRTTRHADIRKETTWRSLHRDAEKLSSLLGTEDGATEETAQLEDKEIDRDVADSFGRNVRNGLETSTEEDKMNVEDLMRSFGKEGKAHPAPSDSFSSRKNSSPSVVSILSSTSDYSSAKTNTAVQKSSDNKAYFSSEVQPIFASHAKSELNVEEPEPITLNRDSNSFQQDGSFPASVQQLPGPFAAAGGFLNSSTPFHHSVIYHDNPKDPSKARSVSYSTVIQAPVPTNPQHEKNVRNHHERRERNYEGSKANLNNFGSEQGKLYAIKNDTKPLEADNLSTTTPSSVTNAWHTQQQRSENNQQKTTTETAWEKQYQAPKSQQKVYGKPEQNYEVDESVSLVTNGRAHGVQSSPVPTSKKDDNQKVGYVVEGRNYRKYRVEERTADGFIVGEYGVVSHDDGSLRGVRYTADGTINPKLIYDTLMKFLSL